MQNFQQLQQGYDGRVFPPGPQNPGKYPSTGPNYAVFGDQDQNGWAYDPWNDRYIPHPKQQQDYADQLNPPEKEPGLVEQLTPIAAGGGALAAGQYLGKEGAEKIPGWLGLGSKGTQAATNAANTGALTTGSTAANAAQAGVTGSTAATQSTPGVLGLGQNSGIAATQEANAAWNAGADAATDAATQETGFLGSFGPAVQGAAGAAGLVLGTKGVIDAHEAGDPMSGALSGAAAGAGASALGSALALSWVPGIGWLAGGGALLGAAAGLFGGKPKTRVEDERMQRLQEQGIIPPDMPTTFTDLNRSQQAEMFKQAGVKDDFVGKTPDGKWVNMQWLQSGDTSTLKPEDIWGYSAFFEKYGKDWLGTFSEEKRREIAQKALNAGAVTEGKGTIHVDWSKLEKPKKEDEEKEAA